MIDPIVVRLLVAALSGLAVGIEREWSGHASGPDARFAGVRTFLLIGGTGGLAGTFAAAGSVVLAAAFVAGVVALTVAAYVASSRGGGEAVEATTEVAAVVVLALGVLAGLGHVRLTSGATAVLLLVLSEKSRMHDAVRRLGATELRAALQFAVLALVVLPLLPDRSVGPLGGIQPRALWTVVLLFSGLNFAGYIARRMVGASRGLGVTGMLGGVVSSTAVTLQFSRQSRGDPHLAHSLGIGVIGACIVLLPRVALVSTVLNAEVARALVPYLAPPFVVGGVLLAVHVVRDRHASQVIEPVDVRSPLRLWSAIKMALAFQAALMAVEFVRANLGTPGIFASAAFLGLTDMDALTIAMNRLGDVPSMVDVAARAIAIGIVANSLLKLALTIVLGSTSFRLIASTGLALLTFTSVVALWIVAA
jgi:uncharacterized membrane protein (DUF4010 family)